MHVVHVVALWVIKAFKYVLRSMYRLGYDSYSTKLKTYITALLALRCFNVALVLLLH